MAATAPPAPPDAARRVARNVASPFAAQIVGRLVSTAYYIVQLRLLAAPQQSGELGQYIIAGLVWLYASTIADWGLGTWLTRELAARRGSADGLAGARTLFAETLAVRLLLAAGTLVPLLGLVVPGPGTAYANLTASGSLAVLLLGLSLLPGAFSSAVTALYNAYERLTVPAAVQIVSAVATAVVGTGTLLLGWGAPGLAAAALATTLGTAGIFATLLRRDFFPPALRWDAAVARRMLREAFPLMVNGLLIAVFFRFDQFVISHYRPADVQIYETAYKFINVTQIITPSVVLAIFPAMARAALHDRAALTRQYRLAVKLLLALALPLVAGTVALATPLITVFTLGKAGYLPYAAWALAILIGYLPFSFINGVTQYVLIAVHRQGRLVWAIGATALFNIGANLVAVPALGIYGAALVTILSELVLLGPFLGWTAGVLGPAAVQPGPHGVRLALAGAGLAVSMAAIAALGLGGLPAFLGGALVYAAALLALRVFSPAELALLRSVVRR